jgi:hypothetical protein
LSFSFSTDILIELLLSTALMLNYPSRARDFDLII